MQKPPAATGAAPKTTSPAPGRLASPLVPFAKLMAAHGKATLTAPAGAKTAPTTATATHQAVRPHGQHGQHGEHGHDRDARDEGSKSADVDPLDPSTRHLAQLAPPPTTAATTTASAPDPEIAPRARVSMEELLPQLVKRIAWAGDRRRGSVQLELGAGRHAGAVVTVHAEDGRVRVDVQGSEELRERIDARLKQHGLDVEAVT